MDSEEITKKFKGKKIIMTHHSSPSVTYETYDLSSEEEMKFFTTDLNYALNEYGITIYIAEIKEHIEFNYNSEKPEFSGN